MLPCRYEEFKDQLDIFNNMAVWKNPMMWSQCLKIEINGLNFAKRELNLGHELFHINPKEKYETLNYRDTQEENKCLLEMIIPEDYIRSFQNREAKDLLFDEPYILVTGKKLEEKEKKSIYYLAWNTKKPRNMEHDEEFVAYWSKNGV